MSTEAVAAAEPDGDGPATTTDDRPGGARRWVPTALVVLATVLAVVSATTTWVRAQALDTDEWVEASSEVLEDAAVREALAVYLVDELYENVDMTQELQSLLPEDLDGLAGPIAGALRGPAGDAVERVLAAPRIQRIWEEANRLAHETFVAIVRDETRENVSTEGGEVVIDLGGVVSSIGGELGVPEAALDRIPDDVGQITVFESSELADVQDLVRVLDVLSWFLFVVVVLLYVLAAYLARGRRRETLRNIGFAVAAGSLVLFALRTVAVRSAVDFLVEDPANKEAAQVIADTATELVNQMAWSGFVLGLVIATYAAFIGPHGWAVGVRRRLGRTSNPDLVITAVAVVALLVLIWWSPGRIFERWVTALTMIGLIVAAAIGVAVTVRDERPEPGSTPDDETAAPGDAEMEAVGADTTERG